MKKALIIVPCYNEEETVVSFYDYTNLMLKNVKKYEFDILYVDDGSTDLTLKKIKRLEAEHSNVCHISFSRNFGKESAMCAGLKYSVDNNYDISLYLDVDLQDNPKHIIKMIGKYEEGYKLVKTRFVNVEKLGLLKRIPRFLFYKIYSFVTKDRSLEDGLRDFALIDNKTVGKALLEITDSKRFTKGLYGYVGYDNTTIDIDFQDRKEGTSKWTFIKLLKYAFEGMFEFSRIFVILTNFLFLFMVLFVGFDVSANLIDLFFKDDINLNDLLIFWNEIKIGLFSLGIVSGIKVIVNFLDNLKPEIRKRPRYFIKEVKNIGDES